MIGERSEQAGATVSGYAVCSVAEFGEQVQHTLRHRPAECKVAGDFGAGVVANEQRVGADRIRWRRTELVTPEAQSSSAPQFPRDEAHGLRILAGLRAELEVDEPDFLEREDTKPVRCSAPGAPAIRWRACPLAGIAVGARVGRPATNLQLLHCLHLAAQALYQRMIRAIDDTVPESDLQDFREGNVRPFGLGQIPSGLEHLIGAERHVRREPEPAFHGQFGRLCRRTVPFVVLAVWTGKLHRPENARRLGD